MLKLVLLTLAIFVPLSVILLLVFSDSAMRLLAMFSLHRRRRFQPHVQIQSSDFHPENTVFVFDLHEVVFFKVL